MPIVPSRTQCANFAALVVVLAGATGFLWAVMHGQFELTAISGAFTGTGLYLLFGVLKNHDRL